MGREPENYPFGPLRNLRRSPPIPLKGGTDWSDIQLMEQPVMRDGTWWQHHGDHWYRWNPDNQQWELGTAPPPPAPPAPAPPPGPVVSAPVAQPERAYTGSGKPAENVSGGDTWSSVTIDTRPDETAEWPDSQLPLTTSRRFPSDKLAVLGFVALAVAVLFGAYTYFFSGGGAPSEEDIDAAFGTLKGYEYQEPPEEISEQVNVLLEEDPLLSEHFNGVDLRLVQRRGRPVGTVAVMGYEPGGLGDVEFNSFASEAFLAGFNGSSGLDVPAANLKQVTRGTTEMFELRAPGFMLVVFIDDPNGMIFYVVASDQRAARNISEQLSLANL